MKTPLVLIFVVPVIDSPDLESRYFGNWSGISALVPRVEVVAFAVNFGIAVTS
jgi:hypothetical protein